MAADPEREVVLVGGGIAAASGLVLLASLFVEWYRGPTFCLFAGCAQATTTGWTALGLGSAVLAIAAVAGTLPLAGTFVPGPATRRLAALSAAAGLGAALLVVFRIARPPGPLLNQSRLAGPFIALLGAAGVAGGSVLAGIGRRIFEPLTRPAVPIATIVLASVTVMISLLLPWVRRVVIPIDGHPAPLGGAVQTVWHVSPTVGVLLLLGALAIACASGLVAVIRWRAAVFALALGGWVAAAIETAATPLVVHLALRGSDASGLVAYESGYYVCLGGCAAIVLAGLWAALLNK